MMFFISIYLFLVFSHSLADCFRCYQARKGVSVIVNFALPVDSFVYFCSIATEQEFRNAINNSGIANGIL